ncbi:uncharacterized protein LOC110096009 isoform X1 [Dendrobium catenatum]|uniref:uncharacterized protein LOC110096009 isoform X1 n=1 Tax=Dendrobium catenatum TaxID=906689 RepID=UPI0010A088FF|nr:uncharacterized protein LOC110096009 isoform X1 [Dendrobium catenatum]
MAGLLAWAADVVGGSGTGNEDDDGEIGLPLLVFTPEQQQRALELDRAAAALHRSIKDLRLRIPPEHISQRLPHLHAHTMASNAALALQLNAHSTTREQAQLREVSLQDENAAYEKAISNCQKKIQEKQDEANELLIRLKELDLIEKDLKENLEKVEAEVKFSQSMVSKGGGNNAEQVDLVDESSRAVKSEELEEKKEELSLHCSVLFCAQNSFDVMVQTLEEEWSLVQKESMKQPSPAQREKALEKQLHSLIEQLTAKQAQAENLMNEIHTKEKELENLNNIQKKLEISSADANNTRNRFSRGMAGSAAAYADYAGDSYSRPYIAGITTESLQKLMLLRSAFVLYILALHVIVFIKISF